MRILGIDYGDSRIGVAVSDALCLTAQGIRTVENYSPKKALAELEKYYFRLSTRTDCCGLTKEYGRNTWLSCRGDLCVL